MLRDNTYSLIRQCFRKCLIIACIISVPLLNANAAATTDKTQVRKASFYINTGLGIDIFSSPTNDQNIGVIGTGPGGTEMLHLTHATRMSNSSTTVSVGVGYIYPVNRWFNLGVRVFANYANNFDTVAASLGNNAATATSIIRSKTEAKLRNFEYGLDLTPGVNIGDNQFFTGIFGLAFNRLRLSNSSEIFSTQAPPITAQAVQTSMQRHVRGLRLGYSLEELLNRSFSIYMTYIWTGYGSVHLLESQPAFAYRSDSGINLQTHHVLFGLKYYFSPQNYVRHLRNMANAFNRFYAHLSFGTLIPQFQDSGIIRDQATTNIVLTGYDNGNQAAPAPMTVLGLGYGFLMHHFYLGAEALMNVNLANQQGKSEFTTGRDNDIGISDQIQSETNLQLRLNTIEAALDFKLGGLIAPETLLFGRVGLSVNHILLQNSRTLVNSTPTVEIISQRINKTVVGLRFGTGIERRFSDNVSLVMNYVYTYYGHIAGGAQSNPGVPYAISDANARVATHAVTIGVNYYFS